MNESASLHFSCACGEVAGTLCDVSPANGDHVVCHCTDCQHFARAFGAARPVLDAAGGTALYQGRCARMRLTSGRDKLACVHLTSKPTLRWYTSCCHTAMFNTYANGRIPYVTVLVANCDVDAAQKAMGPVKGHLFLKEATADPGAVPAMSMAKLMRCFSVRMIKDMVSGDRRRSDLFDPVTLDPIAPPTRL